LFTQSLLLFGISAYGKSQLMNPESFFGEVPHARRLER
jgi:hypothetical protein